jgi:hypothetical protein
MVLEAVQSTRIRSMQVKETTINFRSVAEQAKVSTTWLYNTTPLRNRIMKLRRASTSPVENDASARKLLSQERVISTLRLRIKALEETNRELTEQVEIAYGKLSAQSIRYSSRIRS